MLCLLVLTAALYLPGTAILPLMDRDEPRFAHATVEMMDRETWLIPYFNEEYRFDKPPLTYWWMRLHYELLGIGELAARLHSVIAVFLIAWQLVAMARRFLGPAAGWIAGFSWVTTFQVLVHGRLCVADMPMVLAITVSCRAIMELLWPSNGMEPGRFGKWFWILWLSMAAGFLAKGPVAWLVPGLALVLTRLILWRKPLNRSRLQPVSGLALALLLVGAWGIPALWVTKGAFWDVGMGEHVVKRGTDVFNGRKFIPGFYLLTAFISLFPWIGFLAPLWSRLRASWTGPTAFLAAWFVAPHLIFFAYATQLPHYVMPGFPAFSVLLGLMVFESGRLRRCPRLLTGMGVLFSVLAFALIGLSRAHWITVPDIASLMSHTGWLVLTLFGGGVLVVTLAVRRPGITPALVVVVTLLSAWQLQTTAGVFRNTSATLRIVRSLGLGVDAPDDLGRLFAWEYAEPSLVFYADHRWDYSGADIRNARDALNAERAPSAVVLLRREWTLDRWLKAQQEGSEIKPTAKDFSVAVDDLLREFPDHTAETVRGLNIARTSWVEVVVLRP